MNELIIKLKEDFSEIIKKSDPKEIREFFKPKENLDELVVKCIMFGHYFLGRYFNKPTPDFHYELVRRFFRPGNDYTACPRGFAKALALDTPILTNKGFKNLIDVVVGDFVFSERGKQVKVTYKSEVYKDRDCYEISFSDGSRIVADAGHDWLVEDNLLRHRIDYVPRNGKKDTVISRKGLSMIKKTTYELSEDIFIKRKDGRVELKYSIPTTRPVEFLENILNIDPYFLGQWLGDGNSDRSAITTEDEETIKYLYCYAEKLGLKVTVNKTKNDSNTYYLSNQNVKGKNIINSELRRLKLLKNKHIPFEYKFSSVNNRLELLRGLMDSDGTISKNGHCSFTAINKKLAYDVLELIWSFGIKATIRCSDAKIKGRVIGKYYQINFTTDIDVFNLSRKKERCFEKRDPRVFRRFIVDIKKVKSVPVQCLMVDNPTHLFLAGKELIATHNTTICQLCILYACANGADEFIVLIEKTYTEAAEVLEAIREEAKMNDDLIRVYGTLTLVNTKGKDQENIRDSAGDFFVNGVRLRAKGFDTPIRGLKSRHSRPTRVILDDCESDEHIENVEQRSKYLNNYIKGVIPAVDNDTGVIKMWGTILHDDSLLNTLIKNHNGKIFRAWDEKRELLWPSNWTVEKLEQKREEMRIEGKGDASFYQEYFNEPLDEENQIFRREMFRYFNGFQLTEKILKKPHRIYTLVDPAISKKTTADFTAIVTVLVDELNIVYILQITRARLDPLETIKAIFAHYEKWNAYYVAIETTAYQKSLKYFINEEKMRQKSTVQTMMVVEIKPTIDKVTKIGKMQPKYAIANVYHNSDDPNTVILEEELLRFPKGVHDDVCLTSNTYIATVEGYKSIVNIKAGEKVWTRQGLRKVLWSGKTGTKKVITRYGLTGTPNHPVWTENRGWTELQSLKGSDSLVFLDKRLSGMEKNITDTQTQKDDSSKNTFIPIQNLIPRQILFTAMSGNILMEKSKMACTSIINLARMTIDCLRLKLLLPMNMASEDGNQYQNSKEERDINESQQLNLGKLLSLGGLLKLKRGSLEKKKSKENIWKRLMQLFFVKTAELRYAMPLGENIMCVRNVRREEGTKLDTLQAKKVIIGNVNFAKNHFIHQTKVLNIAQKSADINQLSSDNGNVVEVYNLKVEDANEYFANGILVHNCDCLSNIIEIIIPVQKTVQRKYRAHVKNRQASVLY